MGLKARAADFWDVIISVLERSQFAWASRPCNVVAAYNLRVAPSARRDVRLAVIELILMRGAVWAFVS